MEKTMRKILKNPLISLFTVLLIAGLFNLVDLILKPFHPSYISDDLLRYFFIGIQGLLLKVLVFYFFFAANKGRDRKLLIVLAEMSVILILMFELSLSNLFLGMFLVILYFYEKKSNVMLLLISLLFVILTLRIAINMKNDIRGDLQHNIVVQETNISKIGDEEVFNKVMYDGVEKQVLVDHMMSVNSKMTEAEASNIIDYIRNTGTTVPTTLILAIIERETHFRNVKSEMGEDSIGYVQMRPDTIEWLQTKGLPEISLESFSMDVEMQIIYCIKYLELAIEKYDDPDWVVSAYNAGMTSDYFSKDYVDGVWGYKANMEMKIFEVFDKISGEI